MVGLAARSGAAVQEHRGYPGGVPALLHVDVMPALDFQVFGDDRLAMRVKQAQE